MHNTSAHLHINGSACTHHHKQLYVGEICVPDFDMFHSKHTAAAMHAAARAISGGPVYVSDKPGPCVFVVVACVWCWVVVVTVGVGWEFTIMPKR